MNNRLRHALYGLAPPMLAASALLAATATCAGVAREDILILSPDGRHYTAYKTLRSDLAERQVFLADGERPDDLLFFQPGDFNAKTDNGRAALRFDGGSYALMRRDRFDDAQLTAGDNNEFLFKSWTGQPLANGHYGKWNAPEAFAHFAYVWVVPDNIDLLEYSSNGDGRWRQDGNTLVWTGRNVNDLTFRIRYRVREQALQLDVAPLTDLGTDGATRRITLASGSLFPSGSHQFTAGGEKLLAELADKLVHSDPAQVIVEGHTDNQPLKPYLREKYPSNWELSAARATIVVRWLADHGVSPEILQARAFGDTRPIADNATADGRAKNRRIEIVVRARDDSAETGSDSAADATDDDDKDDAGNTGS